MKNKKTKQIIELNSNQYMNSNNESLVQISSVSSFQTGLEEIKLHREDINIFGATRPWIKW